LCEKASKCKSIFHSSRIQQVQDQCSECPLGSWFSGIALKKHIGEVHRVVRSVCNICGKVIKNHHILDEHKRNFHEGIKEFSCEVCGKAFGIKGSLDSMCPNFSKNQIKYSKKIKKFLDADKDIETTNIWHALKFTTNTKLVLMHSLVGVVLYSKLWQFVLKNM
jgi:hypothetical protein